MHTQQVPVIGQQRQQFQQVVGQQLQTLSIAIYTRVAARHLEAGEPSAEHLRTLAQGSQVAARAFFESMGVQFGERQ